MNSQTIVYCVVALYLVCFYHMLKNVCGCNVCGCKVVEVCWNEKNLYIYHPNVVGVCVENNGKCCYCINPAEVINN